MKRLLAWAIVAVVIAMAWASDARANIARSFLLPQPDSVHGFEGYSAEGLLSELKLLEDMETDMARYVKLGSMVGCEFCCGVDHLVRWDGSPACACDHAMAMRGYLKFLISEGLDDMKILEELSKLKVMFFPAKANEKAKILIRVGEESSYINIGLNKRVLPFKRGELVCG